MASSSEKTNGKIDPISTSTCILSYIICIKRERKRALGVQEKRNYHPLNFGDFWPHMTFDCNTFYSTCLKINGVLKISLSYLLQDHKVHKLCIYVVNIYTVYKYHVELLGIGKSPTSEYIFETKPFLPTQHCKMLYTQQLRQTPHHQSSWFSWLWILLNSALPFPYCKYKHDSTSNMILPQGWWMASPLL